MMSFAFLLPAVFVLAALLGGGNVLAASVDEQLDQALSAVDKGNYPDAVKVFEDLAKAGNAEAQYNLAMLYRSGKGVPKNPVQSAEWFRRAAEQGLAAAQYQLGYLYDTGDGVTKSDQDAFAWYRKAAEQGHAGAQVNLGVMYAQGTGVHQDIMEAYVWFSLAASQGSGIAFKNRQVLKEAMTPQEIEKLDEVSHQYFQKYVLPFQAPTKPRSAPHQ